MLNVIYEWPLRSKNYILFISDPMDFEMDESLLTAQSQIGTILDEFILSCCKLDLNSEPVQNLMLCHQGLKMFDNSTLISQLAEIASMLTHFAASQLLFSSLTKEDQVILLKNNVPLYLQYILARYFNAETGFEQINWILEGQITFDSDDLSKFQKFSFDDFNMSAKLCETPEVSEFYHQCSENISIFYPFPQFCNGLVANMLLYQTNDLMSQELHESNRIGNIFQEAIRLITVSHKYLDKTKYGQSFGDPIKPLIKTLTKMNSIFGKCSIAATSVCLGQPVPRILALDFTRAEEFWLNHKFQKFQDQFRSVVPSKEHLDTLVKCMYHSTPVTMPHLAKWKLMIEERLRRVLKSNSEFEALSTKEQEVLWFKNCGMAITIYGFRLDSFKTGKDQFMSEIGIIDRSSIDWENDYKDIYNFDAMKSHCINDPELNMGLLDPQTLMFLTDTIKELSTVCSNDQLFQLITLITLLDTEGLQSSAKVDSIIKLRQTFLKVYQRKLTSALGSYADFANFRGLLNKIKILSLFINQMF